MSDKNINMNYWTGTVTIPASDTVSTGTVTSVMNGLGRYVEWVTANMEDTDSSQLSARTAYGGTVFSTGTVAESTRFSVGSVFPAYGTLTWVVTAEGTQSGARTIPIHVWYET